MTSLFSCTSLSRRQTPVDEDELGEPNAFDLTWRNYLLPSQFCSCMPSIFGNRQHGIRLEDDDDELFFGPEYYNQHYQGRAVRGYLDNPRDWEFDAMLRQDDFPQFVTRNPFGKTGRKKKKKQKKQLRKGGLEEDLFSDDIQDDAEYLGDEQIAHLAYHQHKDMDQFGEEEYVDSPRNSAFVQEMQPPPAHKEFYAPREMPYIVEEEFDDNEQHQDASTSAATAAQNLLNERLEDLTDKLSFIKQNIMNINKSALEQDRATLHTIKNSPKESNSDRTVSDLDSIASEALDEYESVAQKSGRRGSDEDLSRRHSGVSQFRFPFGGGSDSPPFGSDRHPFSYFIERPSEEVPSTSNQTDNDDENNNNDNNNTPGLSVRGVLDLGKRWFGA